MRRNGFTLIELLVVIAIVAILAAILFPVFTMAKAKANQQKCMNNMTQVGKAMMMYTDDNQGTLPFAWNKSNWSDWKTNTFRQRVQPYIKSWNVFVCPVKTAMPPGGYTPDEVKKMSHYGINVFLTTSETSLTDYVGFTKLSTIMIPSQTIMVSENRDGDWSAEPQDNTGAINTGDAGQFYPYHGDKNYPGGVFAFCDGHAKFMSVIATQETRGNVKFYWWMKIKKQWQ